jgi:hypothetical protein
VALAGLSLLWCLGLVGMAAQRICERNSGERPLNKLNIWLIFHEFPNLLRESRNLACFRAEVVGEMRVFSKRNGTMNAYTDVKVSGSSKGANALSLRDTYWGYVITNDTAARRRAVLVEVLSISFGVFLMMAAVGQWALPGSSTGVEMWAMKGAISVVFGILGAILFWYGQRGLAYEVQVDVVKREARTVLRNRRGITHVLDAVPFSQVGSAFVNRARTPFGASRLYMRLGESQTLIEVASGTESELNLLHTKLSRDMAGASTVPARPMRMTAPATTLRGKAQAAA